jgi:hypothetical protein
MRPFPSFAGFAFLIGLGVLGCRNVDVVTASYATLEEARRDGAIARGWIPEGLPPGTHEIREAHDLDSNRRWGLFNFPMEESDVLRRLLKAQERPLAGMRLDAPARIEWWPVLLRGALNPETIAATGLQAYESINGDLIFIVNWKQGRAYYWSVGGKAAFAPSGLRRDSLRVHS